MKYTLPTDEKTVKANTTARISHKNSTIVCRALSRKKYIEAKTFLEKLKNKKTSIKGKYFTKTVEEILKFLEQLEANARNQNIEPEPLYLFISSHQGPKMQRPRRRWGKFGTKMKICHIQAILSEKNGFRKEIRERSDKE